MTLWAALPKENEEQSDMGCMNMPACLDTSGRCFARTESGMCKALSDGLEQCGFKKPFKDKPEARILTDTDASEIRQDRYRRLTEKTPDPSGDPRLWPYRDNKYGYWIWRGGWICNKCGVRNRNFPDDKTIIPMDWTGSRFCPHCGVKMGG